MAAALQLIPAPKPTASRLVEQLGQVPLFPFPGFLTPQEMEHLLRWRVANWLDHPDLRTCQHEDAVGAWKPLPWDSVQFGFPAARVEFTAGGRNPSLNLGPCLHALVQDCQGRQIRHLTARAATDDLFLIHALEGNGFQLLDGIQTFSRTLAGFQEAGIGGECHIGLLEPWQREGVIELAGRAYQIDRFHSDPALGLSIANNLHREWLRNSCAGEAADAVFVASKGGQVLSYVTVSFDKEVLAVCGKKLATIVLVATSEMARGQGLAKSTTVYALHWLKDQGCDAVTVGTQFRNIAAARLYESCGFRLTATSLTFRKLIVAKGAGTV